MPVIPFEVLDLTAAAGGQYGPVQGRVGANLSAGVQLSADFCHGIEIGLEGQIGALVEGSGEALFIGAKLRGEAAAEAGAKVRMKLEPNLFKSMGLSIDAGAYARAHVGGSVALTLTPQYLAEFANTHLDDFTSDLFLIFLEEVYAEVGVWGKAAFAAMADGYVNVVLNVERPDAGFTIAAGFNVGLEAGCGWDFYCKAGFHDLRRAVLRSSMRLSQEVQNQLRAADVPSPPELALGFDFAFPLVAMIAYDLGVATSERKALLSVEEIGDIIFDNLTQSLQSFVVDRIIETAIGRLTAAFSDIYSQLTGISLSSDDQNVLADEIAALVEIFEKGRIEVEDVGAIIGHAAQIADTIDGGLFDPLKRPLTLLWSASMLGLQIKGQLDEVFADLGISNSALGSATTSAGTSLLPPAPGWVEQEVSQALDRQLVGVDVAAAVDYLIHEGADDLVTEHAPQFAQFRDLLRSTFGLTEGDVVHDLLTVWKGEGSMAGLRSYTALKAFVKLELLDGLLLNDLIPRLQSSVDDPTVNEYINEVVEPSLRTVSDFLFAKLDNLMIDDVTSPMAPEARLGIVDSLGSGCGVVVHNIIVRNISFFDDLVSEFVIRSVHDEFGQMRTWLEDSSHPFFQTAVVLATEHLPGNPNVANHVEAFRTLLIDIVIGLEHTTGPAVLSLERRNRMQELKKNFLLSIGGSSGFSDGDPNDDPGDVIDQTIAEMIDCNVPEGQKQNALDLTGLLFEISVDSIGVLATHVLPGLGDFFLKVTLAEFVSLRQTLLEHIAVTRDALLTAGQNFDEATDWLRKEIDERLETLATEITTQTQTINAQVNSNWDVLLKAQIRTMGEDEIRGRGLSNTDEDAELEHFARVGWPIISVGVDGIATSIRVATNGFITILDGFVALGGDVVGAFLDFLETIEDIALTGFTTLVSFAADAATVTVEFLFPAHMQSVITEYLANRSEQRELEIDRLDAEQDVATERDAQALAQERYDAVAHSPSLDVTVVCPVNDFGYVYPASTEVTMQLHHFTQDMLIGGGNRLQLMINGAPVSVTAGDIEYSPQLDDYLFRRVFPRGFLRDGLNVLEVSWVYGEASSDVRRVVVSFVVDGDAYYPAADFAFLFDYNPEGSDVRYEYVQMTWNGSGDLPLAGWTISDRANHRYDFPDVTLAPHGKLRLYTGGAKRNDIVGDTTADQVLHMGRKAAVWNNSGDTLFLVKDDIVLVRTASYVGTI